MSLAAPHRHAAFATTCRRRVGAALLGALVAATLPPASLAAGPVSRYERIAPSPDGIGKRYLGREISAVMGWQGAAWLERTEREREEGIDRLIAELQLAPGMTVADVGAGTGYVARRIAAAIGPQGTVHAVDVQPEMIRILAALPQPTGGARILPVLGSVDDIRLPDGSLDLAVMVDVYHELEFPYELLSSIVRALKPNGRVVFVEYRAEDPAVPIKPLHKMTEAQVRREAAMLPALRWERTGRSLPWQHVVSFRKVADGLRPAAASSASAPGLNR